MPCPLPPIIDPPPLVTPAGAGAGVLPIMGVVVLLHPVNATTPAAITLIVKGHGEIGQWSWPKSTPVSARCPEAEVLAGGGFFPVLPLCTWRVQVGIGVRLRVRLCQRMPGHRAGRPRGLR